MHVPWDYVDFDKIPLINLLAWLLESLAPYLKEELVALKVSTTKLMAP